MASCKVLIVVFMASFVVLPFFVLASLSYVSRSSLEKLFANEIVREKKKRGKTIVPAVEESGHSQR